jgi:ubiquinone biosynthesis accessory factor UbiJ
MPLFNSLWQTWAFANAARAINTLIQRDPASQQRLVKLNNTQLGIHITSPNVQLQLAAVSGQVFLTQHSQNPSQAEIVGPASHLLALAIKGNQARLPADLGALRINGHIELVGRWQALFTGLDIDWAQWLAEQLPPALRPYFFASTALGQSIGQAFYVRSQSWPQHVTELVQEEWHWSPTQNEFVYLAEQIQQVRMDTDRLQLKLQKYKQIKLQALKGQTP